MHGALKMIDCEFEIEVPFEFSMNFTHASWLCKHWDMNTNFYNSIKYNLSINTYIELIKKTSTLSWKYPFKEQ